MPQLLGIDIVAMLSLIPPLVQILLLIGCKYVDHAVFVEKHRQEAVKYGCDGIFINPVRKLSNLTSHQLVN